MQYFSCDENLVVHYISITYFIAGSLYILPPSPILPTRHILHLATINLFSVSMSNLCVCVCFITHISATMYYVSVSV